MRSTYTTDEQTRSSTGSQSKVIDESVVRCAELLRDLARRMLSEVSVPAFHLTALTAAVQSSLQNTSCEHPEQIQNLIVRIDSLPVDLWAIESHVYRVGISTARIVSVASRQNPYLANQTDELLIAALLQDFGFLVSPKSRELSFDQLQRLMPEFDRDHSELSAALATGIQGCPSLVPCLIRGHHWQDKSANQFEHQAQQFLAIAVAFREALELTTEEKTSDTKVYEQAFSHISLLADQGRFDARLCKLFLNALPTPNKEVETKLVVQQTEESDPVTSLQRADSQDYQDELNPKKKRFRFDLSHAEPPAPKLSSPKKPRLRSAISIRPVANKRKRND